MTQSRENLTGNRSANTSSDSAFNPKRIGGVRMTYYDVLNVSQDATRNQIRESYIRLRQTFNSQNQALYSLMNDDETQELAAQIEEAFKVLNDESKRRQYDAMIRQASGETNYQSIPSQWRGAAENTAISTKPLGTSAIAPKVREELFSGEKPTSQPITKRTEAFDAVASLPKPIPASIKAGQVSNPETVEKFKQLLTTADKGDGTIYKQMRIIADVSEAEMQERTKISLEYLRAIEANRFERLPRLIFVKGFLRSYFRYLAVPDYENLVQAFSERLEDWQNKKDRSRAY